MAICISAYGVSSLSVVNVGAKLTMAMTMDFWDFETDSLAFFLHLGSALGLGAIVGHYVSRYLGLIGPDASKRGIREGRLLVVLLLPGCSASITRRKPMLMPL